MSELRKDPITARWVIISSERGKRPSEFCETDEITSPKACPFCPGHEAMTPPEIAAIGPAGRSRNTAGWDIRIVPNKFPALSVDIQTSRQGEGMYDRMSGVGAHEVIIETNDHLQRFHEFSDKHIEDILWLYRERIIDLKHDTRLEYMLLFKNSGSAAGATLSHQHSQLIATPVVPKRVREEIAGAKSYYEYKERCVYCDIIHQELSNPLRIVGENEHFIALCPFASRFPFEVWVLPKNHSSHYENLQRYEAASLAQLLKNVLARQATVLDNPPFNFIIHNTPPKEYSTPHYHWHLEIMPKLTRVAGFEWGTGFYINPTPPEEAAKFLRDAEV